MNTTDAGQQPVTKFHTVHWFAVGIVIVFTVLTVLEWRRISAERQHTPESTEPTTLSLASPAFPPDGMIPDTYTCDGTGINPPLTISGVPDGTETLALVMEDPDAPLGTFDHWLFWNVPPTVTSIPENSVPDRAELGLNSRGTTEYIGPCPPSGTHRYVFKLFALGPGFGIPVSKTKTELLASMKGYILGETMLIGRYGRN